MNAEQEFLSLTELAEMLGTTRKQLWTHIAPESVTTHEATLDLLGHPVTVRRFKKKWLVAKKDLNWLFP